MTNTVILDDTPDDQEGKESMENETIEAQAEEISPEERLKTLKAMAYDHLSTIEKLQADLRQINDAIKQVTGSIDSSE